MKQIETEKKFIILKPDDNVIKAQEGFTESRIVQIYISDPEFTHRVRARRYGDRIEYTENTKKRISSMSSVETEFEITEERFNELAEQIEPNSHPLRKRRVTFLSSGKTFELDYYDFWEKTCVMEIELNSEAEHFNIPSFINIVADVTDDKAYSNHTMAHKIPDELI